MISVLSTVCQILRGSEGLAQTLHPFPEPGRHLPELSQLEKETVSPAQLGSPGPWPPRTMGGGFWQGTAARREAGSRASQQKAENSAHTGWTAACRETWAPGPLNC